MRVVDNSATRALGGGGGRTTEYKWGRSGWGARGWGPGAGGGLESGLESCEGIWLFIRSAVCEFTMQLDDTDTVAGMCDAQRAWRYWGLDRGTRFRLGELTFFRICRKTVRKKL